MRYDRDLFKAYYVARWASYVPWRTDHFELQDWFEVLGERQPNGWTLTDVYPLQDAQVEELERIWALS